MRKAAAVLLLAVLATGLALALAPIPFGRDKIVVANHYIRNGVRETGATNLVTSVVMDYRALDTLGEVTILFVAAVGVGVIFFAERPPRRGPRQAASVIVVTGSRVLFPLILLFGVYVFLHGHLTPGGGFQGGAVIASGVLLLYLARPEQTLHREALGVAESLGGLLFVGIGLLGLAISGHFLANFLAKGQPNLLLSAGVIPIIYAAVGVKVGAELARVIGDLVESE